MFKLKFYIISIVILSLSLSLVSFAKDSKSEFLPKTKDTKSDKDSDENSKDSMDKESKKDDTGNGDLVVNPDESFKLIAIYLVGNKPRALIKNLEKPEDPAKEFQVGDYVDELQAFSISKILLNPTARIELTDSNGLSYLIKTKNTENANAAQPSKSKSLPSYVSGSNKIKIKKSTTPASPPPSDASSATATPVPPPAEKKDDAASASLESAIKTETSAQTATPPPSNPPPAEQPQNTQNAPSQPATQGIQTTSTGTTQTQTNTNTATPTAGMKDSMSTSGAVDTSRPANPFGE